MTTPPVGVERRIGQRFPFNVPVSLREVSTDTEGLGFTQDLSSRGAFLFTDMALTEGAEIELTLRMPSEITLGESMRVRCRGRVLRVIRAADNGWKSAASSDPETASAAPNFPETSEESSPEETIEGTISESPTLETAITSKLGVAVCLNGYEYLPSPEDSSADYRRISALHSPSEAERSITIMPESPRAAAD
jgi:hypothetical protein